MRLSHMLRGAIYVSGLALALAGCALALPGGTTTGSNNAMASGPGVGAPAGSALAATAPAPAGSLAPNVWVYTVPHTDAHTLAAYYQQRLPQQGWGDIVTNSSPSSAGDIITITAEHNGEGLVIVISSGPTQAPAVTPPAGGVTLQISERPVGT